jgi:hypothetical protein
MAVQGQMIDARQAPSRRKRYQQIIVDEIGRAWKLHARIIGLYDSARSLSLCVAVGSYFSVVHPPPDKAPQMTMVSAT